MTTTTDVLRQTIAKVNIMGVEKTREELLDELRGLEEELARLNETVSEYRQKCESAEEDEENSTDFFSRISPVSPIVAALILRPNFITVP